MTERAVEDLRRVVNEALFEGQKIGAFCVARRFLFWRWTVPHRWGMWKQDGRVTRGDSVISVIWMRQCKRCGLPQFKVLPYGKNI